MKYTSTKKQLKDGIPQRVNMRFCSHDLNAFCNEYGITPIDGFKLWLEIQEQYIDIYMNYGYSISNIKIAEIDDYGNLEYRCMANIEKL